VGSGKFARRKRREGRELVIVRARVGGLRAVLTPHSDMILQSVPQQFGSSIKGLVKLMAETTARMLVATRKE